MRRVIVLAATMAGLLTPAARADDPPFANWPAILPALATGFTPATFAECPDGSPHCVEGTLAEMERRLAEHDAACDDNALFPRNYLVVTRFYQRLAHTGFFADDAYLAREDAVFAKLFFDAEDNWRAGRRDLVPEAWRIAFDAARDRSLQGMGNLLLGINAHVQRDQPYMMAGLGLVAPDGTSRKGDHDKFNELLNLAFDDVVAEAIRWDDPDLATYDAPGTELDGTAAFQIVAGWREGVWRNAERLVAARTDEERRLVAESIEQNAAQWAQRIRDTFTYRPPFTREARDGLCPARKARAAAYAAEAARSDERRRAAAAQHSAARHRRAAIRRHAAMERRARARARRAAKRRTDVRRSRHARTHRSQR